MTLAVARLDEIVARFGDQRVAVIGDLFLDRYLDLVPDVRERSIETGLEAYQVEHIRNVPGAVGTLLNNLSALGTGTVVPLTVIGDDGHGFDLLQQLGSMQRASRTVIDQSFVIKEPGRMTPTYTKPLRRDLGHECIELNRLDVRTRTPMNAHSIECVCDFIQRLGGQCDGILVLDQISDAGQGVIGEAVRNALRELARNAESVPILVDSRSSLSHFSFGSLKGNRAEFEQAFSDAPFSDVAASDVAASDVAASDVAASDDIQRAVRAAQYTGRAAFLTQGEVGILIGHPDGSHEQAEAFPVSGPVDIVGAGDSASSGIILSLLAGASCLEAATIGNLVASVTVQQIGTTGTATVEQIRQRLIEARQ